jgi:large subunit ribosomal protein L10
MHKADHGAARKVEGVSMVSERKREWVKELEGELNKYPVIGLLDMFKMPSRQLQEMRDKLGGKAKIKMVRKSVIERALEKVSKKGLKELEMRIQNQPALLFSNSDPFELARTIESSRSFAAAKEGDAAPKDITVKAGRTSLKAGPVIGELQRVKIPAGVEGENIVIKKDTVVVKEGETINKGLADVLTKLGVEPIEISLNLIAVWEQGIIYTKDILFVPLEKYRNDVKLAYQNAFNLSLNMGLLTKENIPLLLSRAHNEAVGLAREIGLVTKETVAEALVKAHSHVLALKEKMPEVPESKPSGEPEDAAAEKAGETGKGGKVKQESVKEKRKKGNHKKHADKKSKKEG